MIRDHRTLKEELKFKKINKKKSDFMKRRELIVSTHKLCEHRYFPFSNRLDEYRLGYRLCSFSVAKFHHSIFHIDNDHVAKGNTLSEVN